MKQQTEPCPHCKGTGKIKFSPVKTLRTRAGLSQGELAAQLGITQGHLSKIEAGETAPHYQAGKLAQLFKVSPAVIRGEDPIPEPKASRPFRQGPTPSFMESKRRRAAVAKRNRTRK